MLRLEAELRRAEKKGRSHRCSTIESKAMNCCKSMRALVRLIILARRFLIEPLITLSAEAAEAFQKYRFSNGVVLATTLVAVACYEEVARRKGMRPSCVQLNIIAAIAATLTIFGQRALGGVVHS
jgi:hypothetical protein